MGIWLMTAAANLVVGALVGLCGVAGFLLPMFYTAGLGMSVTEGLALSFAAFIISGALDSWNYKKAGNLDVKFGLKLSIGSLIGAILGVKPESDHSRGTGKSDSLSGGASFRNLHSCKKGWKA